MRSIYIIPLSIVFLGIGLIMGYLAKEVYERQRPKTTAVSPFVEDIMVFEDDDFLHSFAGIQDHLDATEKMLGKKLVACIEEKKRSNEQIQLLKDEIQSLEDQSGQSFINRFLGNSEKDDQVTYLPGNVAPMFGSEVLNPVPLRVVDARYRQLFPSTSFTHPREESFGFYQQSVEDVETFLNKRVVTDPSMAVIDMARKKRSKFFQELKTAAFEGPVKLFTESAKDRQFNGKMIFRSPTQNGLDWIVVNDETGATIETRTFSQVDESVWRYNSQNPSVMLLSEQCVWNDQYVYEFKDFFYLTQQDLLVANIYCKKQGADQWERVGTLQFDQIAD